MNLQGGVYCALMVHIQIQYIDTPFATTPKFLIATYVGPAFTNVPMTATGTSTVALGDTAYTHDANGNLTGDATFIYQYDTANQLTNVIRKADNTRVLSCRYDVLGRRVEAIRADGTVDHYIYFPGSFLVLAVLDETNAPKELYTRGPDLSGTLDSAGGIGGILACTYATGPVLCHHADLMGNVIVLTDASGTVSSTYCYTSFGQLSSHISPLLPRHLFSSKEFERAVGLYFYGYRYYQPQLERWMARDPMEEKQDDVGLYRAYKNTPLHIYDAVGLTSSASPVDVGGHWVTGTGPDEYLFEDGDPFLEDLKNMSFL